MVQVHQGLDAPKALLHQESGRRHLQEPLVVPLGDNVRENVNLHGHAPTVYVDRHPKRWDNGRSYSLAAATASWGRGRRAERVGGCLRAPQAPPRR